MRGGYVLGQGRPNAGVSLKPLQIVFNEKGDA